MFYCKHCRNFELCKHRGQTVNYAVDDGVCLFFEKDPNLQTNADRIRAMSEAELAEWLVKKTKYQESAWSEPSYLNFLTKSDDTLKSAIKGTTEWLKQPAEDK